MIVLKFGGSILDGPDGVRTLVDTVGRVTGPRLVVVSAFADVTNRLERIAASAIEDRSEADRLNTELFDDQTAIARALFDVDRFGSWREEVNQWRERLTEIIEGLSLTGELTSRTLDLVVSFGERLSSSIVARALGAPCISALDLIVTERSHRFARVEVESTRANVDRLIRPQLESSSNGVVLTEGYIARTSAGAVTTMGRETSDFSAALFGSLLDAHEVRIVSGVPGIMTADPTLTDEAETIERLDYRTAREIARLGAKVLHPRTLRPVERTGTQLTICDAEGRGTTIGGDPVPDGCSFPVIPSAGLLDLRLDRPDRATDAIDALIRASRQVIRTVRSGRRYEVLTDARPGARDIDAIGAIEGVVSVESKSGLLLSLVAGRPIGGQEAARFLGLVTKESEGPFWSDPEERSVSILLRDADPGHLLGDLHRQFLPL